MPVYPGALPGTRTSVVAILTALRLPCLRLPFRIEALLLPSASLAPVRPAPTGPTHVELESYQIRAGARIFKVGDIAQGCGGNVLEGLAGIKSLVAGDEDIGKSK